MLLPQTVVTCPFSPCKATSFTEIYSVSNEWRPRLIDFGEYRCDMYSVHVHTDVGVTLCYCFSFSCYLLTTVTQESEASIYPINNTLDEW